MSVSANRRFASRRYIKSVLRVSVQQLSSLHGIKVSSPSLPRTGNSWQTTAWKSEIAGEDLTMRRRAIAPVITNASCSKRKPGLAASGSY